MKFQFHGKDSLSVSFVSNWLGQHCPRIVQGMHRYVVHVLTIAYRHEKSLMADSEPHLVPSTPVLDQPDSADASEALLPLSHVWLLAATLPSCYTKVNFLNYSNCIVILLSFIVFFSSNYLFVHVDL